MQQECLNIKSVHGLRMIDSLCSSLEVWMLFPMEGYPLPIDLALIDYMKGCRILDSQARLKAKLPRGRTYAVMFLLYD